MRINKYMLGVAMGLTMLFAACDTDNEGAVYDGTATGQGITFATTTLKAIAVQATDPQFKIDLLRSNTSGAYSGNLQVTGTIDGEDASDSYTVSGFSFADGEAAAAVTVNVSGLEIGKVLALTLAFNDSTNMGYSNNEKLTVNVNVEYNWQSLGMGTYLDAWTTASDAYEDGIAAKVEILKAEGFERYRIIAPYKEYLTSAQGKADWEDWIDVNKSVDPLEIWIEDGLAFYDDFPLGLNYQADPDQPIYGCHPWGWQSMQDPAYWAHNKKEGNVIQLAPYFYIDGVGGWNNTQYDGVVVITLPLMSM